MRLACVFLLCCLAMHSAFADDTNLTLTVDGITYSNVTWHTVTPATVTIFHQTGVASIPLEKLPPELQKRFGYDPQKARQWLQQDAKNHQITANEEKARMARYAEQQRLEAARQNEVNLIEEKKKSAVEVGGEFVERLDGGSILRTQTAHASTKTVYRSVGLDSHSSTTYYEEKFAYVVGLPDSTNAWIRFNAYGDGTYEYQGKQIPRWVWVSEHVPPREQPDAFGRTKQRDPNYRGLSEHP